MFEKYNIRSHEAKYASNYEKFKGKLRSDNVESI
jgi:hypothetical protein